MRVHYVGPLVAGLDHPAMRGYDASQFPPSCYLVEIGDEGGIEGPLIEGDVLVVDEQRPVGHADLVVVDLEGEQRLFKSHRIGGRLRLMPTVGPKESLWARRSDLRGVVVSQARRYRV
ncbi:hypothetical protein [Chromohalobacter sp.]|uniref:hypothetical protein n=1 Tax=Chromohalobacter sp. TaxID=50740 RepID=UPI003242EEFA